MTRGLNWKAIIFWVALYSIAMGFLESAVVVYLRNIYYPYGFDFPLSPLDSSDTLVELIREAATMVMLATVSIIAGKNFTQRLAFFLLSFAIWDLTYYLFLYLLIGWPQSALTWDILFLIPVVWTGPVLAPVIVSFSMIFIGLMVLISEGIGEKLNFSILTWALLITGAVFIFFSFIWDYMTFIRNVPLTGIVLGTAKKTMFTIHPDYIPQWFNWPVFVAGELFVIGSTLNMAYKGRKRTKKAPAINN